MKLKLQLKIVLNTLVIVAWLATLVITYIVSKNYSKDLLLFVILVVRETRKFSLHLINHFDILSGRGFDGLSFIVHR